jgi:hypothetical protein
MEPQPEQYTYFSPCAECDQTVRRLRSLAVLCANAAADEAEQTEHSNLSQWVAEHQRQLRHPLNIEAFRELVTKRLLGLGFQLPEIRWSQIDADGLTLQAGPGEGVYDKFGRREIEGIAFNEASAIRELETRLETIRRHFYS